MTEVSIIKNVELILFQVSVSALFQVSLLSCRNQSIDFHCKSMDSFLYDMDVRHERVKCNTTTKAVALIKTNIRKITINDTIVNWYHKISNIGQIKADF